MAEVWRFFKEGDRTGWPDDGHVYEPMGLASHECAVCGEHITKHASWERNNRRNSRRRELRRLLACAWDEVLDAWDALRIRRRRAWCRVFGHGKPVQRLACVTCSRCEVVVAHLPLGVVQAVQKDGTFTVRLSVGFYPKKDGGT